MKGSLCKLKLVQGRFASVDEDDAPIPPEEKKKVKDLKRQPPDFGGQTPEFDRKTPDFGRKTQDHFAKTPEFGGETPAYSGKIPEFSDGNIPKIAVETAEFNEERNSSELAGQRLPLLTLSESSESFDAGDVNANSTRAGGGPTRPLREALSDGGQFAYCGFLTEALKILFSDSPQDLKFAHVTLKRFLLHVHLAPSTCKVMEMTLDGEVDEGGWKNYLILLKDEGPLANNFVLLVQDLVIFAVQGGITFGNYDARTRVLIGHCACLLNVSPDVVEMFEESVLEFLTEGQIMLTEEEKHVEDLHLRNSKIKRYALIGIATLSGGVLLGLTGGFAAPLIGAGLGTFIGAGGAAAIGSTAGMAVLGSLFGVAGAGLTGVKMKKRIGEVEEFGFEYLTRGSSLHITIAISGWLNEDHPDALLEPWETLFNSREQYCLRYESKYLLELGEAMTQLLQFAFSVVVQETLKYTLLAGIISAITWPASLLTLASVIDNPWGVCIRRSAEVGKQMAQVLHQRFHGRRPVTLIGFSLGARVIYYCLQELATKDNSAGIIQDVILLGAPVPGYADDWKKFDSVVCGRIINGYCQTDWLLRFLYRTSSASMKIAGLQPVDWKDRRMFNFDLSDIVTGHSDYQQKLDMILKTLGIRTRCHRTTLEKSFLKKSNSEMPHDRLSWIRLGSELRRSASDSQLLLRNSSHFNNGDKMKAKEI